MSTRQQTLMLLAALLLWPTVALHAAEPGISVDSSPCLNENELPLHALWLERLDLTQMFTSSGKPVLAGKSPGGKPIMINGIIYPHGVFTYANSFMRIDLKHLAARFLAHFSAERGMWGEKVRALVYVDGKKVYETEKDYRFRVPTKPYLISVDLAGASEMTLVVVAENGCTAKACFAGARLLLDPAATERPVAIPMPEATANPTPVLWLDAVNPLYISSGVLDRPGICGTRTGLPISFQGTLYAHGFVVAPRSLLHMNLKGHATRFIAEVGLNDGAQGSAVFKVVLDKRLAFDSGALRAGDKSKSINVDVAGAKELVLSVVGGAVENVNQNTLAAWGGARLYILPTVKNTNDWPEPKMADQSSMSIASIVDGPEPAIHGPRVVGSSPGYPFSFAIPATGEKPLSYAVSPLPEGLKLDPATGFITGTIPAPMKATCAVTVRNARGKVSRPLAIVCAPHGMIPTPPMGWNHWNQWAMNIDEAKVRAAADAFISKGFAEHGYTYVNIDEGWAGLRTADGTITPRKRRFGDMKALGDYIHGKGLKFGIYSSPGPLCCGKSSGSYDHEQQDADTWAAWGVDYLKYDGCSGNGLPDIEQRWKLMRRCLDKTGRDIVYSTNKYPGEGVQLWRTTMDIRNNWMSLSEGGFKLQAGLEAIAGPGHYNDPDMMVVGDPADLRRGAGLTRNEQITHMTLWSMLAAPLLLGCDLTKADDFLVSLMCNDDVLDIDQDPLVRQGSCLRKDPATGISDMGTEVWTRPLFDGTVAVAFFNRGSEAAKVGVSWKELGLNGPQPLRDCWMRKDLGIFEEGYEVKVESHAAVLLKVGKPNTDAYQPK